jgi:hypothetical protein
MSDIQVRAVKDGLSLALSSSTVTGSAEYDVEQRMDHRVDVWTVDTAAVRPLAIAGLLLGALAGWLIVAVLAYRVRQSGPAHRTAAGVLGAAVLAAAVVPAFAACCDLYQVMIYDTANPNPYIVDSPSDQLPAGLVPTGTGIALLLLAGLTLIAVRGARRGAARTEPESVVPG